MPIVARGDERFGQAAASRAVALLALAGFVARVLTLSHAADNDDAPLFIRGVQRFSVVEGRPHWPGYPVYMAVGKIAASVVGGPAFALQLVSAAACSAIAWPVFLVVRAWAESLGGTPERASRAGVCSALLWLVTPMSWVTGSQIISDPLGLFLAMVIVVLCIRGEEAHVASPWIWAAILAGIMLGVRLVNVSMLGPLVWKCWSARRERWGRMRPAAVLTVGLVAGVAPWLAWLALRDGAGYIQAAEQHLGGHFTRFGESIWTDAHPLQRPGIALRTVAVYGLGAGGPEHGGARVLAGLGWVATLVTASTLRPWRGRVALLIGLWAFPHLAYVFLGHDVALARYALTGTLVVSMWAGLAAAAVGTIAVTAPALTAVTVAAVSLPLAVRQGRQPPVEYQAVRYLARSGGGSVVLAAGSETLLGVYGLLFRDRVVVLGAGARVALVTGQAQVEGRPLYRTALPSEDAQSWIAVAHFCRDRMIEPLIASELWLFRAGTVEPDQPLPACGEER